MGRDDTLDTKTLILKEAEVLFAEKGFDSTGIDEIAKKVGIAKSVIYYHFKNKDDILHTLIKKYLREGFDLKQRKINKIINNQEINLKEILREMMDLSDSWSNFSKIIFMESLKKNEKVLLFDMWEKNINFLFNNFEEQLGEWAKENKSRFFVQTFLMFCMPLLGYQVFGDRLCKNYNINEEKMKKIFIDVFDEYYEQIWKEKVWPEF